ncbi:MAG: MerR family DNA-binding transcriptional regulator [Gammaproteobacteria bacterium]|nr:MerR family DNA-binding transcriptional regulator [Gammaproteobacteria bacterium]
MDENTDRLLTITELADDFGITPRTIRFYETKGLINPQRLGSTRAYNYRDRARLKLILRAKRLGFSLVGINEYLNLYEVDPEQLEQQQLLLVKVNKRIADLEQQQEDLATSLDELREIQQQAVCSLEQHGLLPE